MGADSADAFLASETRKPRIYNATLHSGLARYFSRCEKLAIAASLARLPLPPISTRSEWDDQFGLWLSVWEEPSPKQIEDELRAFGGLTRSQWQRQEADRLANTGDVWVSPGWALDFNYDLGVGLVATLPCELLTVPDVHAFALDFFGRGEPDAFESPARLAWPGSARDRLEQSYKIARAPLREWAPPFGLALRERQQLQAIATAHSNAPSMAPIRL